MRQWIAKLVDWLAAMIGGSAERARQSEQALKIAAEAQDVGTAVDDSDARTRRERLLGDASDRGADQ
jgi:hypothetical protein